MPPYDGRSATHQLLVICRIPGAVQHDLCGSIFQGAHIFWRKFNVHPSQEKAKAGPNRPAFCIAVFVV
jgi:hypothetical protein